MVVIVWHCRFDVNLLVFLFITIGWLIVCTIVWIVVVASFGIVVMLLRLLAFGLSLLFIVAVIVNLLRYVLQVM